MAHPVTITVCRKTTVGGTTAVAVVERRYASVDGLTPVETVSLPYVLLSVTVWAAAAPLQETVSAMMVGLELTVTPASQVLNALPLEVTVACLMNVSVTLAMREFAATLPFLGLQILMHRQRMQRSKLA